MITHSAFAPGRVELLGNHTDYNEGYVLSAAIDRGVSIEGFATENREITLTSETWSRSLTIPSWNIAHQHEESWANYPLGVIKLFRERGMDIRGFSATVKSTLPSGAGLSSSAALEVATGKFLEKLSGFKLHPLELAKLCRQAENEFVGVNCGLLDQVSSIFGKAGHAVYLDCRTEQIENIPLATNIALMITHSGVKHRLVGGEYNERREQCFSAAKKLRAPALRDVSLGELEIGKSSLTDLEFRRALHIVGENTRVQQAVTFLRNNEIAAFGQLMFQSHESSKINFENSIPELDMLVEIAAGCQGVYGSRLSGGGFGGATVSIVNAELFEQIAAQVEAEYKRRSGIDCEIYHCVAAPGAV